MDKDDKVDWMDPECREMLLEKLGEDKVALIDELHHRNMRGWQIMNSAINAFMKVKRAGKDISLEDFVMEFARKEAIEETNKMSMQAYMDACASGPVACGPVILDEEE